MTDAERKRLLALAEQIATCGLVSVGSEYVWEGLAVDNSLMRDVTLDDLRAIAVIAAKSAQRPDVDAGAEADRLESERQSRLDLADALRRQR